MTRDPPRRIATSAVKTIPVIVAALFILAAAAKYFDLQNFSESVSAYSVLPSGLRRALPVLVPSMEMWIGCLMLVSATRRPASIAAAGLLLLFCAFQGWLLLHPEAPACRCYGALADWLKLQNDVRLALVRNVVLELGLLAFLFIGGTSNTPRAKCEEAVQVARRLATPRGFALVELLVVVGVIAILLGILLPVVGAVRRHSQDVKCQSQLRSIAQAALSRAAETRGYLPLAGRVVIHESFLRPRGLPDGLSDSARIKYAYLPDTGEHMLGVPTREFCASFSHSLLPWLGVRRSEALAIGTTDEDQYLDARFSALRIFRCGAATADPDYEAKQSSPSRQIILESSSGSGWEAWWWMAVDYAFNGDLLGFHHADAHRAIRLRGNLAACRDPAATLLMADAACQPPRSVLTTWSTSLDAVPRPTTLQDVATGSARLAAGPPLDTRRHKGRINVCFVDGHVESILLSDSTRLSQVRLSGQ